MNFRFRRKLLNLTIIQIIIFILSFVFYHKVTLLSYINISFYVTATLLLASLLIYTIHSGFFDVISKSFNKMVTKRSWDEIPSISELVSINQKPILFYGFMSGIIMLTALFFYYY